MRRRGRGLSGKRPDACYFPFRDHVEQQDGHAAEPPVRRCNREEIMIRSRRTATMLAAATLAAALATPAFAADPAACQKVRFADVGWTDIQATTGIAFNILEALGYKPEVQVLSVPVTYQSLKNKDIDVFLGNWMPSMTGDVKPFLDDKSVESVSQNLEGAGYGLVVPQSTAAKGLKSLKDIGKFKKELEGKIYGIEPGNDGNRIVLEMIKNKDNGLDGFELVESSEAGMLAQAEKTMKDGKDIVFLGWTPHPVMGEMKIAYLDGMGDSGFGAATVHTNVRAGYLKECPNAGKFVANLKFTLSAENKIMDAILKGAEANKAARDWLKANGEEAKKWLAGVTTFDGKDAAAALTAALAK
jgi:glycine betaine/proline transport system substrate-binding protein